MIRAVLLTAILVAVPVSASAQLTKSQCATIAESQGNMDPTTSQLVSAIESMDVSKLSVGMSGPSLEAAQKYEASRSRLLFALQDFQNASENLQHQMRLCAQ